MDDVTLYSQILKTILVKKDVIIIPIHVTANARRESLSLKSGVLSVKVSAPAVENKANERIIALFSKWLLIARSSLEIVKGAQAKSKQLSVKSISNTSAAQRLTDVIMQQG